MKFRLEPLSPVYIGCGRVWNAFSDYITDKGKILIINFDALIANEDIDSRQIDDYVQQIRKLKNDYLVKTFLKDYQLDHTGYIIRAFTADFPIKSQAIYRTVSTTGGAYIPGSSLKGALRTALLYAQKKGKENPGKKDYTYTGQDEFGPTQEDVMKFLQAGDSSCFTQATTLSRIENINLTGKKNKPEARGVNFIVEMINPGEQVTFRLKTTGNSVLHSKIEPSPCREEFNYLLEGNEKKILPLINAFSQKNIQKEIQTLRHRNQSGKNLQSVIDFYLELDQRVKKDREHSAIIRIGGHKSIFDQVVYPPEKKNTRPQRNHTTGSDGLYPVSRDFILKGEARYIPPGWVKISCG